MTTTDNKRHNYNSIFKYNNRQEAQHRVKGYNNKAGFKTYKCWHEYNYEVM